MKSYSLPVSYIREFLYCNRIPYFYEIYQIKSEKSVWLNSGKNLHLSEGKLIKRRTFNKFGISNDAMFENEVLLNSQNLNLHGKIDAIIFDKDKIYPIEIKTGSHKYIRKGHLLQLCAYSLLLEEKYEKICDLGFIIYRDISFKNIPIKLDSNLKKETKEILFQMQKVLENGNLPKTNAEISKCSQCEFLNYCNDRI